MHLYSSQCKTSQLYMYSKYMHCIHVAVYTLQCIMFTAKYLFIILLLLSGLWNKAVNTTACDCCHISLHLASQLYSQLAERYGLKCQQQHCTQSMHSSISVHVCDIWPYGEVIHHMGHVGVHPTHLANTCKISMNVHIMQCAGCAVVTVLKTASQQ